MSCGSSFTLRFVTANERRILEAEKKLLVIDDDWV